MVNARRLLSLTLVASLGSFSLAGCGAPTAGSLTNVPASGSAQASSVTSASALATDFATQLCASGFKATAKGAVVTVEDPNGPVTYDFSATPQTGKVTFRAGEIVSSLDTRADGTRMIPVRLIMIAAKMVWGGAKAWYWYSHTHTGAAYSREDLAKAIVYGMIQGGVSGLPLGFLWSRLMPIVWKWVTGEAPIAPTLRTLFEFMKHDLNQVTDVLAEAERLQPQGNQ